MVNRIQKSTRYGSVYTSFYNSCGSDGPKRSEYKSSDSTPYKAQVGADTPNYRMFTSVNGYPPINNYEVTWSAQQNSSGFAHVVQYIPYVCPPAVTDSQDRDQFASGFLVLSPYLPVWAGYSDLRSEALANFVRKARNAQTSIQAGVSAGEALKTLRGIFNPVDSIARLSLDLLGAARDGLKRHGRRSFRDYTSIVGDLYLTYQYNVKPLVADLTNGVQAWRRLTQGPLVSYKRVQGKGPPSPISKETVKSHDAYGAIAQNTVTTTTHEASYQYYGYLRIEKRVSNRFLDEIGLNYQDFLPTVWELIPFSFLVDQLTNVGDVISAGSFDFRSFVSMARCYKATTKIERTATLDLAKPDQKYGNGSIGYSNPTAGRFERTYLDPKIFYETPAVAFKHDWRKEFKFAASVTSIAESRLAYRRDLQARFPGYDLSVVPPRATRGFGTRALR